MNAQNTIFNVLHTYGFKLNLKKNNSSSILFLRLHSAFGHLTLIKKLLGITSVSTSHVKLLSFYQLPI